MIKNIAIVILLFSLILLFKNQPSDGSLVKDTVITVDSVYVPYPEYVTVEVIVPAVVDTQAIINAHFEKRVFSDSVKTIQVYQQWQKSQSTGNSHQNCGGKMKLTDSDQQHVSRLVNKKRFVQGVV